MSNFRGQNGAFVVIFKDDSRKEVFLVFRTDYPVWVLSGGGIEPGESPEKSAIREAFEETGFETRVVRQVGKYIYANKSGYLFEGRYVSGDYKPEFKGNIGRWFPTNKLPLDITSSTRQKIYDAIHHKGKPFEKQISSELPFLQNLILIVRHPIAVAKFVKKSFVSKK
jgi:8-oxo-dGTP pyrophosphatase MutT (NUDIX family)